MTIHEFFYNENNYTLTVEFSTKDDDNDFYRILKLEHDIIEYYSPTIITDYELRNLDEDMIREIITEYLKDNDLPEQLTL